MKTIELKKKKETLLKLHDHFAELGGNYKLDYSDEVFQLFKSFMKKNNELEKIHHYLSDFEICFLFSPHFGDIDHKNSFFLKRINYIIENIENPNWEEKLDTIIDFMLTLFVLKS